ncbi:MAG: hypothetical protein KAQ68_09530, partial [Clostridiales bacterium]|nr:hypothetical protein [Clostridiales bacterium]
MSISLFAYSIACVIYIIIGIHTYNADRKSKANRLFLVTSSTLAFWAFCLVLMSATNNPSVAANYRWITIIASSCLYVEILNFVLIITGKNKYSTKLWFRILIYTPAVINFYIYFFNPIPAEYMLKITGTWAYMHPLGRGFIFDYYFTAYYSIYAIIATILLIRHSKKAKFLRERKQSRLMYISFIVVAIITTFTTVILPMLGYLRMPPLTTIVSLISVFGVWYSLKKYSMMNLSGDTLLLEVSQIMYEGIIIFDNQDHIIRINKGTEELLGCSMTDCADSSAIKNLFPSEIWEFNITHQGFECNINTLYETSLPVMLSVHILKDNFDEKSGTVLYFQDLTQIKDANAALAEERNKLEVRVSERTLSLKTANKQLAEEIELRIAKEKEIEKLRKRLEYAKSIDDDDRRVEEMNKIK